MNEDEMETVVIEAGDLVEEIASGSFQHELPPVRGTVEKALKNGRLKVRWQGGGLETVNPGQVWLVSKGE